MVIRHNKMFSNVFLFDNLITLVSNKPSCIACIQGGCIWTLRAHKILHNFYVTGGLVDSRSALGNKDVV